MKFLYAILATLAIGTAPLAHASDTCCHDDCCFEYSVFVDYLYWKVTRQNLQSGNQFINPNYTSGYRVGGSVSYNCWELDLYYTSLNVSQKRNTPFNITGFYFNDYHLINLEFGHNFAANCVCARFRPFVGVKYANIDEKILRSQSSGDFYASNDIDGCGPYVGIDGKLRMFSCPIPVYLIGKFDIGFLNSTFSHINNSNEQQGDQDFLLSTQEIYIALGFPMCFSCFNADFQIGYEGHSYSGMRGLFDDGPELGVSGLVLHFEAAF